MIFLSWQVLIANWPAAHYEIALSALSLAALHDEIHSTAALSY